jgi:hypothetical protein
LRKTNPESIAKTVNAITPRSVLLSTNTKNAHIQLVSQKSNIIHPLYKPIVVVVSSSSPFFEEKYVNTSLISPVPKIRTNIQLKKFIATAIVSGANQNRLLIGCMRAKKNVINICHNPDTIDAGHIFHRRTP